MLIIPLIVIFQWYLITPTDSTLKNPNYSHGWKGNSSTGHTPKLYNIYIGIRVSSPTRNQELVETFLTALFDWCLAAQLLEKLKHANPETSNLSEFAFWNVYHITE